MAWVVGVDVGGTFTDFYAFDSQSGKAFVHKVPSTPASPAQAIIEGLRALCTAHDLDFSAIQRLSHGTTVATNALLQRGGVTVALITTQGFRDLLEIGRQVRPHMFSLQEDYPAPLVPRQRRFEVKVAYGSLRRRRRARRTGDGERCGTAASDQGIPGNGCSAGASHRRRSLCGLPAVCLYESCARTGHWRSPQHNSGALRLAVLRGAAGIP